MAMDRQLTPIVFVPSKLLLEQWAAQLSALGIGVVRVGAGHTKWISQGSVRAAIEASAPDRRFAVVATLASAGSEQFKNQVVSKASHVLAIFDEAHRAGAPMSRHLLEWFRPRWRLGLSATPERANDPEGTSSLLSYFHGIVDRYSLKDALDDGVLTPYRYQPAWVGLQDHEIDEWERLTLQIQKLHSMSKAKGASESVRERLRMKLIERSRIAKNASRKIPKAVELVAQMYDPRLKEKWLVYCDNQTQLREVRSALGSRGIDSWEYHSEMPGDPEATLSLFDINGGIVVAIKCLDEGVDIPSATHALILASSRNPREFIQRRGRVLRRSPSKSIATLLDVLVLPEAIDPADPTWGLVVGELARARQFAAWAVTQDSVSAIEDKWVSMGLTLDQFDALVGTGIEGDDDSGD
jgi:superfamily II DNA or RNA helicase